MKPFVINGILWKVVRVGSHDARLIDRTGQIKLATTDPHTRTVHLSSQLKGKMLETVLIHEVGHCILISYGLLPFLHTIVKEGYEIAAEEWVCNILANYSKEALHAVSSTLGYNVYRKYRHNL